MAKTENGKQNAEYGMRNVSKRGIPHSVFWWVAIFYIAFMFLPRLTPTGMFGDGLLYSSIARNLAEGRGSWWAPFFSSGYWIEGVAPTAYYENPPLMLWMQAGFFRLFGDHWWVEKLYALLLLALNCWLISRVWEAPLKERAGVSERFGWVPVWLFYFIPIVAWGSPNNLMDSQLLTFCLLSLWCSLTVLFQGKNPVLFFALASIFIFFGILTKGPVALYPVAAPLLYALIFERKKWLRGLMQSASVLAIAFLLFFALLWLNGAAFSFFQQYWEQRLAVALQGGRADGLRLGWGRLYIFWLLLRENSMILGVSILLLLAAWRRGNRATGFAYERKLSLFFLLLAFAATVPVMASTRQAGMYLIPGLALFAVAAGYFHLPWLSHWLSRMGRRSTAWVGGLAGLGILIVVMYATVIAGKPGREKALLHDLTFLKQEIPSGGRVAACEHVMSNFVFHVYLQRFAHLELTRDSSSARFFFTEPGCESHRGEVLEAQGFHAGNTPLKSLLLYAR